MLVTASNPRSKVKYSDILRSNLLQLINLLRLSVKRIGHFTNSNITTVYPYLYQSIVSVCMIFLDT